MNDKQIDINEHQPLTAHINNGGAFSGLGFCNPLQLSYTLTVKKPSPRHNSYAQTVNCNSELAGTRSENLKC
ncbi:hypothetical protein ACFLTE_07300, partial [Bacteroidota bacterium]